MALGAAIDWAIAEQVKRFQHWRRPRLRFKVSAALASLTS